jgi:hypothetical protein
MAAPLRPPPLPSTRILIALLTDEVFSHALKVLDPALTQLADPDDAHAQFLAALSWMYALVNASSENLLLPHSLVAKLSAVADAGSTEAIFCLHWIALFALERDDPLADNFALRLRKAGQLISLPVIQDGSLYRAYFYEFVLLLPEVASSPEVQRHFLCQTIALLVRFAELLNGAMEAMSPPFMPHTTPAEVEAVLTLTVTIHENVLKLNPLMASTLRRLPNNFEQAGYLCCTAAYAVLLFAELIVKPSNETLAKCHRMWKRGAVAGSVFCQYYLSCQGDRRWSDLQAPPGYSTDEYEEAKKFWTMKYLIRAIRPRDKARFELPLFREWLSEEQQNPPAISRWTAPRLDALHSCRACLGKLLGWGDAATLAVYMKAAEQLAKVLQRRLQLAEEKKGTFRLAKRFAFSPVFLYPACRLSVPFCFQVYLLALTFSAACRNDERYSRELISGAIGCVLHLRQNLSVPLR